MTDLQLPIVVTLNRPIELDGETINKLSFDEPDMDAQVDFTELTDKMANSEKPTDRESLLAMRFWISRLAGISEAAAGKIKACDGDAVNDAVGKILRLVEGGDPGNGAGA